MIYADAINGFYEFFGSAMIWLNVWQAHKDRRFRGVTFSAAIFFTTWSYWNLYYYPHLHQWLSFTGGVSLVLANTAWLVQMFIYRRKV